MPEDFLSDIEMVKNKFKNDILKNNCDSQYLVQKYICNGHSPILDDETLFLIKHSIAKEYDIHPNEVIVTGSGKLGFSIAPSKLLRNFNDESDIDIAIISSKLFNEFWVDLLNFNINTTSHSEKESVLYREFLKYFFKGWIRPDKFSFQYREKNKWFNFFNELQSKIYSYGEHKISAGIFKDFYCFELYNIKNIDNIKIKLKETEGNE